nr:translation initiation factor IF-2-like [Symphalangus syndactylus]
MRSSAPRGPTEPALRRPSSAERPLAPGPSSSPGAGRAPGAMASPSRSSEATGKPRGRDGRPRREEEDVPPEEKRLRLGLEGEAHSPRTARTGRTRRGRAGGDRHPDRWRRQRRLPLGLGSGCGHPQPGPSGQGRHQGQVTHAALCHNDLPVPLHCHPSLRALACASPVPPAHQEHAVQSGRQTPDTQTGTYIL